MITFGIKDIIDIVLVALLLYYIYRLMKESSSANIFAGILVLIVVWIFVSHIFEMRLLGGLLDRVVNMGAIALIILFQHRHAPQHTLPAPALQPQQSRDWPPRGHHAHRYGVHEHGQAARGRAYRY